MRKSLRTLYLILIYCILAIPATAQNIQYAKKTINTLCGPKYHGRGYVKNGMGKAAEFIYKELKKLPGVEAQYQPFAFTVNTFPGKMQVKLDGKELNAGIDYMVEPGCPTVKGTYPVKILTQAMLSDSVAFDQLVQGIKDEWVLVIDTLNNPDAATKKRLELLKKHKVGEAFTALIILSNNKLLWSVATEQDKFPEITVKQDKFPRNAKEIKLNIKAEFNNQFIANNVLGYIKGTKQPDSIIVFSAHYDHLGRMGKSTYFPGANDNASGTALLLDLAAHYSKNPPEYSVLFIAFAAEEAGLIGSNYYVNANPVYPLANMRFIINLDLLGTGEKGIMAVNGLVFTDEYNKLVEINSAKNYLSSVQSRGKAANSDHYWFTEKGVHGFFLYLMGDFPYYHDPGDKAEILPLTEYEDTFRLLVDFSAYLQGK